MAKHTLINAVRSKVVTKVLDVKDIRSCLALIFPLFSIGIEDSMSEQVIHGAVERRALFVVFEIGWNLTSQIYSSRYEPWQNESGEYKLFRIYSTLTGSAVPIWIGIPRADRYLHASVSLQSVSIFNYTVQCIYMVAAPPCSKPSTKKS